MPLPFFETAVKKWNLPTCLWILCMRFNVFMRVAPRTCPCQIGQNGFARRLSRENMITMKRGSTEVGGSFAIFTKSIRNVRARGDARLRGYTQKPPFSLFNPSSAITCSKVFPRISAKMIRDSMRLTFLASNLLSNL